MRERRGVREWRRRGGWREDDYRQLLVYSSSNCGMVSEISDGV